MLRRASFIASALVLLLPACRRHPAVSGQAVPAAVTLAAPAPGDPMPEWYPATLPADQYLGAAACAGCHREQYAAWQKSPHGHAMAPAGPGAVLGDFGGQEVRFPEGSITPARRGDDYFIAIGGEQHRVELVLGSGRQHQLYLVRTPQGSLQLLPAYWATQTREWLLTTVSTGASLDPNAHQYWQRSEVISSGGCVRCHLSQGRTRTDGKAVETRWVDLSINCEACHGPGRAHVEARSQDRPDPYRDLKLLSKEDEGLLCAQCHAAQRTLWNAARAEVQYVTVAASSFRADASQLGTPYQYGGHVSSSCYLRGAVTCSACHDPHRQTPRNLAGESALGERADLQCSVCHRDLASAAAKTPHSHHRADVRCIDCHMPLHWLTDSPKSRQRVADHSISIPRPQETVDYLIPNACNECHHDKDPAWALTALRGWNQAQALGVRPWVRAFALGKRRDPAAKEALVGVLTDPASGPFWRASALELLTMLPPDPALVPVLAPFSEDRDPVLRGYALRALWTHDAERRDSWLMGADGDDDPLVRAGLMSYSGPLPVPDEHFRRWAIDLARYLDQPPGYILPGLAAELARHGQPRRALLLLDLALPHATPLQIENERLLLMRTDLAASLR